MPTVLHAVPQPTNHLVKQERYTKPNATLGQKIENIVQRTAHRDASHRRNPVEAVDRPNVPRPPPPRVESGGRPRTEATLGLTVATLALYSARLPTIAKPQPTNHRVQRGVIKG